jgi:hypothetical protein
MEVKALVGCAPANLLMASTHHCFHFMEKAHVTAASWSAFVAVDAVQALMHHTLVPCSNQTVRCSNQHTA